MHFHHLLRPLPSLKTENINGQRHYHTPTGGCYPSVTSVLSRLSKDSIKAWRERVGAEEANKITQRASSRGTSVHKLCEQYIKNEKSKGDIEKKCYKADKGKVILNAPVDAQTIFLRRRRYTKVHPQQSQRRPRVKRLGDPE